MKLSQLLRDLAQDLNDAEPGYEHTAWPAEQLAVWYNEGLCNAFALNPTKFAATKVVKLVPGEDQEVCGCTILHEIVGQTDAQGLITKKVSRENADLNWRKPTTCRAPAGGAFALTNYTFDALNGGVFTVKPPVPPNADVYMKVRCFDSPKAVGMGDEVDDCQVTTAAKQWVLFRALMRDDDSAAASRAAVVHAQMFFQLLNAQFSQQLAMSLGMSPAQAAAVAKQASAVAKQTPAARFKAP